MQFDYKKDLVTVNTSALAYSILKNNVDLNRISVEVDESTGRRMFVLEDYTEDELEAYKSYIKAVKSGTEIQVNIIEFNHIYSCLKQMVVEFKSSESDGQKVAGAIRNMQGIFRENNVVERVEAEKKSTCLSDIGAIIQQTMKESNIDTEEFLREINPRYCSK